MVIGESTYRAPLNFASTFFLPFENLLLQGLTLASSRGKRNKLNAGKHHAGENFYTFLTVRRVAGSLHGRAGRGL